MEDKKNDLIDAEVWCRKGLALSDLGKYEEAIQAYDETIRIKPDHEEAWYNKGFALGMTGRPEEALTVCNEGLKRFPESNEHKSIKKIIEDTMQSYEKENHNLNV